METHKKTETDSTKLTGVEEKNIRENFKYIENEFKVYDLNWYKKTNPTSMRHHKRYHIKLCRYGNIAWKFCL